MLPETFAFKGTPYAHQRTEVTEHWQDAGRARFWEMGTGKSYATIHEAAALYEARKIEAMIVVAPKGVYRNWERELAAHWPMATEPVVTVWGSARKPLRGGPERFRVYQMNVEAL